MPTLPIPPRTAWACNAVEPTRTKLVVTVDYTAFRIYGLCYWLVGATGVLFAYKNLVL